MSDLPIGGRGLSPPNPQRSTSNVDDAVARLKFDAAGSRPAVVQDEQDGPS